MLDVPCVLELVLAPLVDHLLKLVERWHLPFVLMRDGVVPHDVCRIEGVLTRVGGVFQCLPIAIVVTWPTAEQLLPCRCLHQ